MNQPAPSLDQDECVRAYLARVEAACRRSSDPAKIAGLIREAQREEILDSGWTPPAEFRRQAPGAPYTRNLVHQDPAGRFTVILLVWGPFQETPVHDHLNWCVVGTLEGRCLAIDYDREDDERGPDARARLAVRETRLLGPGDDLLLLPPARRNIHKMGSADHSGALTLHTYGDPGTRARVYDLATGSVMLRDLEFHHR